MRSVRQVRARPKILSSYKSTMARLTLARKIAAITLIVWKKRERFDAKKLKPQPLEHLG